MCPKQNLSPELIIGTVGGLGTNLKNTVELLKQALEKQRYSVIEIRVSDFFSDQIELTNELERIEMCMDIGSSWRKTISPDILALLSVAKIRKERANACSKNESYRVAYIINSLKNPEEVNTLKKIYNRSFILLSIFSPKSERIDNLSKLSGQHGNCNESYAVQLINKDEEDDDEDLKSSGHGQAVRKCFHKADYFLDASNNINLDEQIQRFTNILFGSPFITPTKCEVSMMFAHTAALRSADSSRQVGAAIINNEGDVLATGCNDIAKFGGGLYWPEDIPDGRDFKYKHGINSNKHYLDEKLRETAVKLAEHFRLEDDEIYNLLIDSPLANVTEYSRVSHAESTAIATSAKLGVTINDSTLYVTTFPCHTCSKSIIASGITHVVYIEPYPKSHTSEFFSDSVIIEPSHEAMNKVIFKSFIGVAPKRFLYAFNKSKSDRTDNNNDIKPQTPSVDSDPILVHRTIIPYYMNEYIFLLKCKRSMDNNHTLKQQINNGIKSHPKCEMIRRWSQVISKE